MMPLAGGVHVDVTHVDVDLLFCTVRWRSIFAIVLCNILLMVVS
jgi:hypothetical protein